MSAAQSTLPDDAADAAPIPPSDRVGRFVLLDRLGAGGMGIVHAAYDPQLDRKVALKLLRDAGADPESRSRMLREAKAMARLGHPNVVAVYEMGEHDGRTFIAMELVHGQTLKAWLRAQPRSQAEIVDAFMQAGRGLAAAHEAGVVHRDFKPDNVLVDDTGRVRVTDFGLARALATSGVRRAATDVSVSEIDLGLTQVGAVVGTPAYMSPEQIMGRDADPRSDQFSYCVALWEALTGRRPYEADNLVDLAMKLDAGQPADLADVKLPAHLAPVLRRGLARAASDRWASIDVLLLELERAQRRRDVRTIAVAVAGVATLAALGFAANELWQAGIVHDCQERGQSFHEAFADPARDRLARALAESDSPLAAEVEDRVLAELDRYVARLEQRATDTCIAENVEDALAGEAAQARRLCLDERAASLEGTVDLLSEPSPTVALVATRAVHELPRVDDCEDDEALAKLSRLTESVPSEVTANVRRQLDEARRLGVVGRYDQAITVARSSLRLAEAAGSEALIAEAALMLGRSLRAGGKLAEASMQLAAATEMALQVGHDVVAVTAATKLAFLIGHDLEKLEDGLHAARLALALVHRFDLAGTHAEADALDTLGSVHFKRHEYADAALRFEAAVATSREALGEIGVALSSAPMNLGNAFLMMGDFSRARASYEEAIAAQTAVLGAGHPNVARSQNGLAALFHQTGQLEKAGPLFEEVLRKREAALGPDHLDVAESLINVGQIYRESNRADEAVTLLRRAVAILERAVGESTPPSIRASYALGLALEASGAHDEARTILLDARARLPASGQVDANLRREIDAALDARTPTEVPCSAPNCR